jgi:hypothetical protein
LICGSSRASRSLPTAECRARPLASSGGRDDHRGVRRRVPCQGPHGRRLPNALIPDSCLRVCEIRMRCSARGGTNWSGCSTKHTMCATIFPPPPSCWRCARKLKQRYGNMTKLIAQARTASELSTRLQEFKHIGLITARIFTREVAPIWYGSRGSSPKMS